MIDKWFRQDIEAPFKEHKRVVVTDKGGNGRFLVNTLHDCIVIEAGNELEIEGKGKNIDALHVYAHITSPMLSKFHIVATIFIAHISYAHDNHNIHIISKTNSENVILKSAKNASLSHSRTTQ